MTARRRVRRVVGAVVAAAVVVAATGALGLDPEPLRMVLLVLLAVAGGRLLLDAAPGATPPWYPASKHAPVGEGRDPVMQSHLRLLENHQLARHPDGFVRDRLASLADRVLVTRHGVHARTERGRALLGPELDEVLHGPVVRLKPHRVDRILRQIEEL